MTSLFRALFPRCRFHGEYPCAVRTRHCPPPDPSPRRDDPLPQPIVLESRVPADLNPWAGAAVFGLHNHTTDEACDETCTVYGEGLTE